MNLNTDEDTHSLLLDRHSKMRSSIFSTSTVSSEENQKLIWAEMEANLRKTCSEELPVRLQLNLPSPLGCSRVLTVTHPHVFPPLEGETRVCEQALRPSRVYTSALVWKHSHVSFFNVCVNARQTVSSLSRVLNAPVPSSSSLGSS